MEQVYRHYAPVLARYLRRGFSYRIDGHPAVFSGYRSTFELEGAVQEVFMRAFEERARLAYDGLRPYHGFLCGIARNVVLDELRRRARRGEVLSPFDDEESARWVRERAPSDPADAMDAHRASSLVNQFLEQECSEEEQQIYQLRYERGLSQEAAAEEAGMTRIQVRRRENKLKKRLLSFLKRMDYTR